MLFITIFINLILDSLEFHAMCGVIITLSICVNLLSLFVGSFSSTSSAAPAILFSFNAFISSFSSINAPRAVLIIYAVGFISDNFYQLVMYEEI